jgi:hypothetical protein
VFESFHRHHRHHHPAAPVTLSAGVFIHLEPFTMQVTLTWTAPAFRADGVTPLTLPEIVGFTVLNNGAQIGDVAGAVAGTGANTFTDPAPGSTNSYTVTSQTTDGLSSAPSNAFVIAVAPGQPAAAITDLAGTLVPNAPPAAAVPLTNAQISARNSALIAAGKPIPR